MSDFTLNSKLDIDVVSIPGIFFDYYLPEASGTDVKVYLCLLRAAEKSPADFDPEMISGRLDLTEKELLRSLSYWEEVGLLQLTFNSKHTLTGISINNIAAPAASGKSKDTSVKSEPTAVPAATSSAPQKNTAPGTTAEASAATPSQEQRAALDNDEVFQGFLSSFQFTYFHRPLTPTECERLGYWYQQFQSSADIIEYLLDYCARQEKMNIQYITKVAEAWHRDGYRTLEDIKKAVQQHQKQNSVYSSIMKTYGVYDQKPAPVHQKLFDRWLSEYRFSLDMVLLACEKTILAGKGFTPTYTDKILSDWMRKNIRTPEDVAADDAIHTEKQKQTAQKAADASIARSVDAKSKRTEAFHFENERTNNNYMEKILKQIRQS